MLDDANQALPYEPVTQPARIEDAIPMLPPAAQPARRPRGRPRKTPPPTPAPTSPPEAPQDYGQELIIDIHEADPTTFTRQSISHFMHMLCNDVLHMEMEDLHFWDYEDEPKLKAKQPPHLKGISAVQFIKTSNITIHTLDDLRKVFVNIFSCKQFNPAEAEAFTATYFAGKVARSATVVRQ
jgi:S-adenosylmethionine/arginine decarboxylase-like enzyme